MSRCDVQVSVGACRSGKQMDKQVQVSKRECAGVKSKTQAEDTCRPQLVFWPTPMAPMLLSLLLFAFGA